VVPSAVKVGLAVLALTVAVVLTLPWLRRRGPG